VPRPGRKDPTIRRYGVGSGSSVVRLPAILALVLIATACGGSEPEPVTTVSRTTGFPSFERPGSVDEVAGTYRGVGIGDSPDAVRSVFGPQRPMGEGEAATALEAPDEDDHGPRVISFEPQDPFGPILRYPDVVVIFKGRQGVGAFVLVEPEAETSGGIAIGDPLNQAKSAYPSLRCGIVNEGTEYVRYPACTGRIAASRHIWFGGDPIRSIALSTHPFDAV
jgi:hypothetical protein